MFRIAICDDKMQELEKLRYGIEQWLEENTAVDGSVTIFRDSKELAGILENGKRRFDLYLLDIMMDGVDGIRLGRLIRSHDPDALIIYVTLSPEYALEAYGIHAIRYLVKPVGQEELYSALNMGYALFSTRPRHTLLINGTDSMTSIIMEEIMYVENHLRNVIYTMNDGNCVVSVRRSGTFEEAVGALATEPDFLQPHKSFFVNIKYIRALQSDVVLMDDGREIPVARRRMTEIQNRYIQFISEGGKNL